MLKETEGDKATWLCMCVYIYIYIYIYIQVCVYAYMCAFYQ